MANIWALVSLGLAASREEDVASAQLASSQVLGAAGGASLGDTLEATRDLMLKTLAAGNAAHASSPNAQMSLGDTLDATRDLMLKTLVAGNAEGVQAEPLWRMMASANHKCPEGQRNPRQDECLKAVKQAVDGAFAHGAERCASARSDVFVTQRVRYA